MRKVLVPRDRTDVLRQFFSSRHLCFLDVNTVKKGIEEEKTKTGKVQLVKILSSHAAISRDIRGTISTGSFSGGRRSQSRISAGFSKQRIGNEKP